MIEFPPRTPESVPMVNATDFHAFIQSWRLVPGKDSQIVIVKASFRLTPDAPATPLPEEEQVLPEGETPFDDAETVRYPGDLAFFKPKADVFLTGHAYGASKSETVQRVELLLGRSLAFNLAAIGDRVWTSTGPSTPKPFEKIALRPELAFGGPSFDANPVGRGHRGGTGDPLPNLERPGDLLSSPSARPKPIFPTPVASTWRERAGKTGTYKGDWATKRAPYFPDDFDWAHFNAAPRDLQIDYPRGDERYTLSGVRPKGEQLSGSLPGSRVRAFAQPKNDTGRLLEIPMRIDTVYFEPDELRLLLVWRGAIVSADAYGSDLASIFVCAEPMSAAQSDRDVRALFDETLVLRYAPEADEEDPETYEEEEGAEDEPPAEVQRARQANRPTGVTPRMARELNLPGWMVSVPQPDEPPPAPMPPPPPPGPSVSAPELAALLGGGAPLAETDLTRCDLSGADLRGRDLRNAHLVEANLDRAILDGADLTGAVLSDASANGASFVGAKLDGADLAGAKLEGANFTDASLEAAVLTGIKAGRAQFERAKLLGATAPEAFLFGACFDGADLSDADFSAAILEEATFRGAKLNDTSMYDARGRGMIADDAEMLTFRADGAELRGASLQRVKAADSSLRSADLREANLTGGDFTGSIFVGTKFDEAVLSQIEAKGARFGHASFHRTSLLKANLMRADFEGANLAGADLRGANLFEANTFNTKMTGAKLDHAIRST